MSSFREIIAKRVSLDGSVSSDTGRSILAAADGAAVRTVIDAAATANPAFTGAATFANTGNVVPLTITNAGTANSFVINDEIGDTTPFVVSASGDVGIGTSSPSVRFHVSGNSRIDGSLNINNAFTLPTTDGASGQVLSTNGSGTVTWQTVSGGGGGGISDGDKGDITVSGSGATWTIDSGAVSYAKIQNVSATDRILGRSSAGSGVVEEIACTAAGRALIDDADAAAQRTTLGLGTLATQSVEIIHPFLLGGM